MFTRIDSEENSKIKLVRKLRMKKSRDAMAKFTIEGINLVSEAIRRGIALDFVILSRNGAGNSETMDILGNAECDVYQVPDRIFDKISDAVHGSDVMAVVSKSRVISDGAESAVKEDDNVLILDRLQDPGNIGTIIRTAYAAGYRAVYALKGTADVYSPKILRATAGMIFDIPVFYVDDIDELRMRPGMKGKKLAVTMPGGGVPYYEADLSSGTALVIGNEGRGVSDKMAAAADIRVNIPMREGIDSLNAAVAAALLMYEAVRK